jgi:hypothetical protein
MDICVATCCLEDIKCLDILLRSLGAFGDLASCDLLVSHNSTKPHNHKMLAGVCRSHPTKSVNIDFFETKETQESQQHGEALNRLIARTTSKYVVAIDPDIIVTSPRWLDFCKRHIDDGCFIVGTPYEVPKLMWQGDFPNVWCAMIYGDALRAAGLDMRPYRDSPAQTPVWSGSKASDDLGEPDIGWLPESTWKSAAGAWAWSRDTSWRLAAHGLRNRLRYVPFSVTSGLLPGLLREWSVAQAVHVRRRAGRAADRLARLRTFEFAFPGTDEACCLHMHSVSKCRTRRWTLCASMVLDACGAASAGRRGNLPDPPAAPEQSPRLKSRPKMTRQQRRSRRSRRG